MILPTTALACQLRVGVSIAPQTEFVKAVGGADVEVAVAVPLGSSPETFELDWATIKALSKTQAYFAIGDVPFEAANLGRIAKLNRTIRVYRPRYSDERQDGNDHHQWMSPLAMITQINLISEGLSTLCPAHASQYRANANRYIADLGTLDRQIKLMFASKTKRTFIIDHPVLDLFAKQYHLTQLAVEKDGKEPTSAHLRMLLNQAKSLGIRTFFAQKAVNDSTAHTFAESMHAKLVFIDPFSPNYQDNMRRIARQLAQAMD